MLCLLARAPLLVRLTPARERLQNKIGTPTDGVQGVDGGNGTKVGASMPFDRRHHANELLVLVLDSLAFGFVRFRDHRAEAIAPSVGHAPRTLWLASALMTAPELLAREQ